jgi:hypothetical protein
MTLLTNLSFIALLFYYRFKFDNFLFDANFVFSMLNIILYQ